MLIKTVDFYTFKKEFVDCDRDHFSDDAYKFLFDYYNNDDLIIEFDVVAICCDWDEFDKHGLFSSFGYLIDDCESYENSKTLIEKLKEKTYIVELDETYLVQSW